MNTWEPRTANLEKPLVILSQTGVTDHSESDVNVFGTPYVGGMGDLPVAAWNIRCGRNAGLASAAKGLTQMGVDVAVLMEMEIMDDHYPHFTSGYNILSSKVASQHQGGLPCCEERITPVWRWRQHEF